MYLSNFYEPWLGKKSFSKKWDTSKLKKIGITLKYSNTALKECIIKCYFFDGVLKSLICIYCTIKYFVENISKKEIWLHS